MMQMVTPVTVKRVGIIGGGQLAWMMADAVQKLELELIVQTPSETDPAVAIATQTLFAPINDAAATIQLANLCDVITFENEFINLDALAPIAPSFYPRLTSLAPLLDKYHQRSYLQSLHLPTPEFIALSQNPTLNDLEQLGLPVVVKARRQGYDGKGTFVVRDAADLAQWQNIPAEEWLLESFVPFECELAVMAARSRTGEVCIYPVVETQQVAQVCRRVFVLPQPIEIREQVEDIARSLLTSLDFVGIMGIEFFLVNGKVLVNETAPRTHNSGHYSLDTCVTSQFEQQLRAVCGLPLGNPALHSPGAVMVNLLGYKSTEDDYLPQREQLARIPNAYVYWYGKNVARPGRKMGHVTVVLQETEREDMEAITQEIESIWYP
jgi:5-(carboxyamino)imidazole ribonucleotide synthase